jgi:hypothetical protein
MMYDLTLDLEELSGGKEMAWRGGECVDERFKNKECVQREEDPQGCSVSKVKQGLRFIHHTWLSRVKGLVFNSLFFEFFPVTGKSEAYGMTEPPGCWWCL